MAEFRVDGLDPRGSEELIGPFFADAAVGLSITDIQGHFLEVNQAYCALTGYTEAELKARDFQSITHPDDLPRTLAKVESLLSGEVSSFLIEKRYVRKDAIIVWVLDSVSVIRDKHGRPLNLVRLSQDITERKKSEDNLRLSEERYRELFENAKDALYVHDLSGRYTSFNRAAEQLSGYSREEILGKHFSNFVAPGNLKDARTNFCRKLDIDAETTYEIELVRKDRSRVPVEVSSRLIYENGKQVGIQGVARDISDRKRAREALRTYSQRLLEAQEAEREVVAREFHDEIEKVLTGVRMNLETLQRSMPAGWQPSGIDESLSIIDEALGRVRELSLRMQSASADPAASVLSSRP